MKGKLGVLIGFGAGYVLGARAGRERYEQIVDELRRVRNDPRVQRAADQAMGVAAEQAQHVRDAAADKAHQVAEQAQAAAKERMPGSSTGDDKPDGGAPVTPLH